MTTASAPRQRRTRGNQHRPIDAAVVRERRLQLRIPTEVLADVLGSSAGAIDHLEHGGEQNHLTISFTEDLARALGMSTVELLTPTQTPAGDGDLIDVEDPATVGRILAEVGTVLVDDLAVSLNWTLDRTHYALTVLEDRLPAVGQRLSWLADSQVTLIHAPGDPAPVGPVTRRTITAWGLNADETALVTWVTAKGHHRATGQELNPVLAARLKHADILTTDVTHGPREPRHPTEEALRLTEEARFNLCLDADLGDPPV